MRGAIGDRQRGRLLIADIGGHADQLAGGDQTFLGQTAAAIRLIVQLQRLPDGSRRITSVAEITGMEGEIVQMQEIYKFQRLRTEEDGKITGQFVATGIRPRFLQDLVSSGVSFPASHFDPSKPL